MRFTVRPPASTSTLASLASLVIAGASFVALSTGCSSADQGGGTLMGGDDTGENTGSNVASSGTLDSTGSNPNGSSDHSSSSNSADAGSSGTKGTGSTGSTGSTTTTTAPGSGTSTETANSCVSAGDKGTATGIGQFCTTISDCTGSGNANFVCTAMFNAPAGDTFCTSFCNTDADCADGTTCFTDPATAQSACLTAACVTLAKSKM